MAGSTAQLLFDCSPEKPVGPYVVLQDDGKWEGSIIYTRTGDDPQFRGHGIYIDGAGRRCSIPDARMKLVAFLHDDPTPQEQVAHQERRRYQQRSRTTAQQRANARCTAKQVKYIQFLARRKGMDTDDIRAMVHGGSISALSVREAGALIDRLKK